MGKLMRNGEEIGQFVTNVTYSAEGDSLGDAAASDVVAGKTFSSSNGVSLTGTLPNLSTATTIDYTSSNTTPVIEGDQAFISTNSDGTQRVAIRYNGSTGVVNGNTLFGLASSNFGNASASHVLSGKTFTSPAGLAVAGTMTNNGAVSKTITPSTSAQTYTIPAGYHNGSGKITVSAISNGYKKCAIKNSGSVTVSKDATLNVTIPHELGVRPTYYGVYLSDYSYNTIGIVGSSSDATNINVTLKNLNASYDQSTTVYAVIVE